MVDAAAAATCSSNQSDMGVLDMKHKLVMMSYHCFPYFIIHTYDTRGVGARSLAYQQGVTTRCTCSAWG